MAKKSKVTITALFMRVVKQEFKSRIKTDLEILRKFSETCWFISKMNPMNRFMSQNGMLTNCNDNIEVLREIILRNWHFKRIFHEIWKKKNVHMHIALKNQMQHLVKQWPLAHITSSSYGWRALPGFRLISAAGRRRN